MRILRNPLYNSRGGFRRIPRMDIPHLRFSRHYPGPAVQCPDAGKEVFFVDCLKCERFAVWHSSDGELKRCWYKFKDLASRGYYDGTWDDHPENFDAETFAEIQARKKLNAEFLADFEREKPELERMAQELAANSRLSDTYEYYWEHEGQDEDDEEDEPDRQENDEDEYA